MIVETEGTYVGWVTIQGPGNISAMYSCSAKALTTHPHLVDCETLSMDEDLVRILEPIRNKNFFIEKFKGNKEPRFLFRDIQSLLNELQSDSNNYSNYSNKRDENSLRRSNSNSTNGSFLPTYLLATERGFSSLLLTHITAIGWEHIENITSDMSQLTLSVQDSRQRKHCFDVIFNTSLRGYPWAAPKIIAELPMPVVLPHWPVQSSHGGNLSMVLAAVVAEAEQYADFLDILHDLDTNCCVLEPMSPSFAITTRRIALERSCSIYIDFPDPKANPFAMCNIRFLGPPDKLARYSQILQLNAHLWKSYKSPPITTSSISANIGVDLTSQGSMCRENIQEILGITLPLPRQKWSSKSRSRSRSRLGNDCQSDGEQDNISTSISQVKRLRAHKDTNEETEKHGKKDEEDEEEHADNEEYEYVTECGICYAFDREAHIDTKNMDVERNTVAGAASIQSASIRSSGSKVSSLPEQVCPNSKCGKMFHQGCLLEWLQAVPSSRTSFGTIFGSCPYCHEWLSVKSLI